MKTSQSLIPLERELSSAFLSNGLDQQNVNWLPLVDVYESNDAYLIEAELPGLKKEEVRVRFEEDVIIMEGVRKSPDLGDNVKTWRDERQYGKFTRSFRLTKDIDPESITASMQLGVLRLEIKKSQKSQGRVIPVSGE